jgi:hypothetical protein
MMNNTDEWKWNIMLDSGKQPHMTAVSPANIRYVDEAQPILPKVNDLNCIENEFIAPTVSAHGYGNPGGGASWSYNQSAWHALGMDANSVRPHAHFSSAWATPACLYSTYGRYLCAHCDHPGFCSGYQARSTDLSASE